MLNVMLCMLFVKQIVGIHTLLIDIVLCLPKDQFIVGTETIKIVVALNGLFEKKDKHHTFPVKVNTSI